MFVSPNLQRSLCCTAGLPLTSHPPPMYCTFGTWRGHAGDNDKRGRGGARIVGRLKHVGEERELAPSAIGLRLGSERHFGASRAMADW